jgi:hypothetical protein
MLFAPCLFPNAQQTGKVHRIGFLAIVFPSIEAFLVKQCHPLHEEISRPIEGGYYWTATEAEQVRWFLKTYGDENSWLVGGEISVGLNKLCQKDNDSVREWKKHNGAMHFGIGHGADRGKINSILRLEGITDYITITIDDTVVCEKGQLRFKIIHHRDTEFAECFFEMISSFHFFSELSASAVQSPNFLSPRRTRSKKETQRT